MNNIDKQAVGMSHCFLGDLINMVMFIMAYWYPFRSHKFTNHIWIKGTILRAQSYPEYRQGNGIIDTGDEPPRAQWSASPLHQSSVHTAEETLCNASRLNVASLAAQRFPHCTVSGEHSQTTKLIT